MFLYGYHPCLHALQNPRRVIEKVYLTDKNLLEKIPSLSAHKLEIVDRKTLSKLLPPEAIHQGIALKVQPLKPLEIEFLETIPEKNQCVVVLDQVCDPHNIGAILRSCGVFGASALLITDKNAPKESAIMAKSASGALEIIPFCFAKNLVQGLKYLKELGFWCVGLSEKGSGPLSKIDLKGKVALVLGHEGSGMRRLTEENCDFLAFLPSSETFSTLNVSNAAAVSLYEVFIQQKGRP